MSAATTERTWKKLAKYGITPESIAETTRKFTAYHEAGHAVVALALGARNVEAWVNSPCFQSGVCHMLATFRPGMRPVVGVAGKVAEAIMGDGWDEDFSDYHQLGEFSQPDIDAIGDAQLQKVATVAHAILSYQWDFVERIAQALIEKKHLTAREILDLEGDS